MKTEAAIRRASQQARNAMQEVDRANVDALLAMYADTAEHVKAAIAARADASDTVPREQLQNLLRQIEDIVLELGQRRDAMLMDGLTQAADLGVRPYTMQGVAAVGGSVGGEMAQAVLDSAAAMRVSEEAVQFVQSFQAADGLTLSDRLWRLDLGAKETLQRTISNAVVQGWSASRAAAELAFAGQAVSADVQGNLTRSGVLGLQRMADLLLTGDGGEVWKADRVMRTEINRAHGEAYMAGAVKAPSFAGFKFLLSPRHPKPDICDLLATQNLHGLGKGVYPTREKTPWPAHPNTLSFLQVVFKGDVTDADRAGKETELQALQRMAPDVREGVLGVTKAEYFDQGLLRKGMLRSTLKAVEARLERTDKLVSVPLAVPVQEATKTAVREFVDSHKVGNTDARLSLGALGGEPSRFLRDALDRDPTSMTRTLEASAVRHVLKNHGNAKTEALRGQVAITKDDFALLQQIAMQGRRNLSNETNRGSPVVHVQLSLGGYDYTVKEAVRRSDVTLVTMWKKKTKSQ